MSALPTQARRILLGLVRDEVSGVRRELDRSQSRWSRLAPHLAATGTGRTKAVERALRSAADQVRSVEARVGALLAPLAPKARQR